MGIGGNGLATGYHGGGCTRGGGITAFVRMSDSCCRACRLISAMGICRLAGDGFYNDLVRSCAAANARSTEDGMVIVRLDGNQATVSEILSHLTALIHIV